jgi:hypothetical protein
MERRQPSSVGQTVDTDTDTQAQDKAESERKQSAQSYNDGKGRDAVARIIASLPPNATLTDVLDELKKQIPSLPNPLSATEQDGEGADAGQLAASIMQLDRQDPGVLLHQLEKLSSLATRISNRGGTYADTAAVVRILATEAISRLHATS